MLLHFLKAARKGLGTEFYERVQEAADEIELNPEGFQKAYKDMRRVGHEQFTEWALFFRICQTTRSLSRASVERGIPRYPRNDHLG